ncbi:hypothetical protein [Candidatus Nitrotoga sp. HW29]|uniref:hypothetical protein n=1 Tax=Candidatus Nitrotoga sp. HW29 TaxID=2886963 RepID=UPI001EF308F9|nr:hypothetical protein [Candidatus Nitrotoga sp. HW29]
MGIFILVMLAWAVYSAIRAVVVFIKPRMRAKPATRTPAASMPNEPDWAGLETPTFIRRGLVFPVLTVKKQRVRKKKIQVAA